MLGASAADVRVDLAVSPQSMVLGRDDAPSAEITLKLFGDGERPAVGALPVVHSTAGTITHIESRGPGRYAATLEAPDARFPQLAVLNAADTCPVAFERPPQMATAVVSYAARIDLRGRTEPQATMQVRIGRQTFGPVRADAEGRFSLPVVVPPGERYGYSISTDELGNASHAKVDLYLPEVERLHGFVYPSAVVAGGDDVAWMFVTTVAFDGAPEDTRLVARAARGRIEAPVRLGAGLYRIAYHAPRELGDGTDAILVRHHKSAPEKRFPVALLAAAPVELRFDPWSARTPADGATATILEATVHDRFGNLAAGHTLVLVEGGNERQATEVAPGRFRIELEPRDRIAEVAAHWKLVARSAACPRAELVHTETGWQIRDRRGIACRTVYRLLDAAGMEVGRGTSGVDGMLAGNIDLAALQAGGGMVQLPNGEPTCAELPRVPSEVTTSASPTLDVPFELRWEVPSPVVIAMHELERGAGRILVRIAVRGAPPDAARLRLQATSGAVEVVRQAPEGIDVAVPYKNEAVTLVVTDIPTGVSGWLRLE